MVKPSIWLRNQVLLNKQAHNLLKRQPNKPLPSSTNISINHIPNQVQTHLITYSTACLEMWGTFSRVLTYLKMLASQVSHITLQWASTCSHRIRQIKQEEDRSLKSDLCLPSRSHSALQALNSSNPMSMPMPTLTLQTHSHNLGAAHHNRILNNKTSSSSLIKLSTPLGWYATKWWGETHLSQDPSCPNFRLTVIW